MFHAISQSHQDPLSSTDILLNPGCVSKVYSSFSESVMKCSCVSFEVCVIDGMGSCLWLDDEIFGISITVG